MTIHKLLDLLNFILEIICIFNQKQKITFFDYKYYIINLRKIILENA